VWEGRAGDCSPYPDSSVIVAPFTPSPCGSWIVPESVAVFTWAAEELAKQNITAQTTKYMRIRILRCMSPPGLIAAFRYPSGRNGES
jgi:hypothetical protein